MSEKIGNNLRETQEQLIKLIGFDYDVFRSTACFEQGSSDAFSKLTPKEAKQVVMKILQLGKFDEYERICRDIYNQLWEKGSQIKQEIETFTRLSNTTITDVKPIEDKLSIVNKELIEYEKTIEGYRELDEKYIAAETLFKECKNKLENIDKMDKCPICLQEVKSAHKETIREEFTKDLEKIANTLKNNNIKDTLRKAVNEYNTKNIEATNLANQLDELKRRNDEAARVLKDKKELEEKFITIKKDAEIYKKLIEAFGKNGIPSYIIENTIPEVESIVNELLDLIDIEMFVKLDTQKELKSGGTSDTLDINISTNGIVRPYFGYSGGERFIIDLSLRIALSIILLRRKGCNNSTLIIDEGMGSLDSINRDKVIKLIKIIKEKYGFKKILVISHMEDIQDSLENKIVVEKVEDTSKLSYNI